MCKQRKLVITMNIGLLSSPSGGSPAPASATQLGENGQPQQPMQIQAFSTLFQNAVLSIADEQTPSLSETEEPLELVPSAESGNQTTGPAMIDFAVVPGIQLPDLPTLVTPQIVQLAPLPPSGLTVHASDGEGRLGSDPVPTNSSQPSAMDSSVDSLLPPVIAHNRLGETPEIEEGGQASDARPMGKDRGASGSRIPVPVAQLSGDSADMPPTPPASLTSVQWSTPVMEDQGARSLPSAASINVAMPSLDRASAVVQEPEGQRAVVPGQVAPLAVMGTGGGQGDAPLGSDAEGTGERALFHSGDSREMESATRGNQSPLFNGHITSAMQAQSSPQAEGSSGMTATEDRLKAARAFLGEDHSGTMTSGSGKAQTVHVELPSHGSGPLSVRISMTDQTVHTQFTTDRNDLGALLLTRQDQLQQNLTKSGLELGQFQVHVNQGGHQDALPDRQSRRNSGASDQPPTPQDHHQQAQDRDRPEHRPRRALSLFA